MNYQAGIGFIGAMALGRVESASEHALNDPLATVGRRMAGQFPAVAAARAALPSDEARRGFDIGIATTAGNSQYGPGQAAVYARLHTVPLQSGFIKARDVSYTITLAGGGPAMAAAAGKTSASPSGGGDLQKGAAADAGGLSPVVIAGAAAGVLAVGAAVYFLVLKK